MSNSLAIEEKVRRFYDRASPHYLEYFGLHIHDGYYITGRESKEQAQENLVRFLVEKAGIEPGSRILDVGCGIGGSSVWLAENLGAHTVGITISPVQIEIARRLAREHQVDSAFLLMNAETMDFSEQFDIIWVLAALTHFESQEQFFKRAARYLRPHGKLVIYDWTINADIPVPSEDRDIRTVIESMVLAGLYSRETYLQWLEADGFRTVFTEDITGQTLQTWDDVISLLKDPGTWKLAVQVASREGKELRGFFKGLPVMRRAMRNGKVRSSVIVAERIML
jgi:tocopherol O-methyltransferase